MVVIAVIGVLAAIAIPTFRTMGYTSKRAAVVNDLLAAFQMARSESIKRGTSISVCAGNGSCTGATTWTQGWTLFVNTNGNTTLDTGELILKQGKAAPKDISVNTTSAMVTFRPYNVLMVGGTLTICTPLPPTENRDIVISSVGRARAVTTTATCSSS